MASWEEAWWESSFESGLPRADRRSGTYLTYVPDPLAESPLLLPPHVDELVAAAERAVRSLSGNVRDLAGIARFLLRSEAIASSRIEGIAPAVKGVALAELGRHEIVPDVSAQARMVANNQPDFPASALTGAHQRSNVHVAGELAKQSAVW